MLQMHGTLLGQQPLHLLVAMADKDLLLNAVELGACMKVIRKKAQHMLVGDFKADPGTGPMTLAVGYCHNATTKYVFFNSDGKTTRPTPKCIETISQSQRGFNLSG